MHGARFSPPADESCRSSGWLRNLRAKVNNIANSEIYDACICCYICHIKLTNKSRRSYTHRVLCSGIIYTPSTNQSRASNIKSQAMQNDCSEFLLEICMVSTPPYHIITKERSFIIVGVMLAKLLFYILLGTYSACLFRLLVASGHQKLPRTVKRSAFQPASIKFVGAKNIQNQHKYIIG
jgi:hypothetical protein